MKDLLIQLKVKQLRIETAKSLNKKMSLRTEHSGVSQSHYDEITTSNAESLHRFAVPLPLTREAESLRLLCRHLPLTREAMHSPRNDNTCHCEEHKQLTPTIPSLVGKNVTNHSTFQPFNHSTRKAAFTLAEVLITLAVIGIVAAMTMPVLINKVKDKQYDRAREKALMSIGEAGRLLAVQGDIGSGTNAEDFVKNYLSKKLKIVKTCDSNNLEECGLPSTIKKLDGTTTMNMPKTIGELGLPIIQNSTWKTSTTNYGFLTANGYAVNLFYNPNCITDTNNDNSLASGYVCMNAIYDMNGLRNPNTVGKDIGFVTVLYPNEQNRAVAPNPVPIASASGNWQTANNTCANMGKEYSLPDKDELMSMAINGNLIGITSGGYWSSSTRTGYPTQAWKQNFIYGHRYWANKTYVDNVRCVRR